MVKAGEEIRLGSAPCKLEPPGCSSDCPGYGFGGDFGLLMRNNPTRWFTDWVGNNRASFVSSDRSSYSDVVLLYICSSGHFFRFSIRPLMQWCYKSLKQYQCNWSHKMLIDADWMSNVQMFKCSNVQILKCSNVQMFKYSNVQIFKCSNVKFKMSVRLNFCRRIPPEFLQSFCLFVKKYCISTIIMSGPTTPVSWSAQG